VGGDGGQVLIQFVGLRLLRLVVTLLACSFVVYGALYLAPGGVIGAITGGRVLSDSDRAEIIKAYHLDDPFVERYTTWLGRAVTGDLGQSLVARQPVIDLITPRIETTAMLVGYSGLLIIVFGIGLGLLAATRGGQVDRLIVAAMSAFAAVPGFVAAAVLLSVFAVQLGLFPSFGSGAGFTDRIHHMTLPAVALALAAVGYVGRVSRSAVLEEQDRDHVLTAWSRGIPGPVVVRDHVLRNAMVPITTTVGITIASLIAGSVVVEQVFALNGLGSLLLTGVGQKDYAVVQAVALVLVASFVVLNAIVDMSYPILDPRIGRHGSS